VDRVFDVMAAQGHFRRNHGVLTLAEILELGLSRKQVRTWVANGHLVREHRGVYRYGPLPLTEPGRFLAAAKASGAGADVSYRAAAHLLGFLPHAAGRVDVTVPKARRPQRGITLHCRLLPREERTTYRGIPVTTPERTLYDLSSVLPRRRLRRALHEAEVQRRTTHAKVARFLETHPGARTLRKLVAQGPSPTRSYLEDDLLELIRADPTMPKHVTNTRIAGFEVDLLFPEHGLVIEADGGRYHDTPTAKARDAEEQAHLEAKHYKVLRLTSEDINRPDRTRAHIHQRLKAPSSPPAPPPRSATG
jgi:very-short-patch-repair endonuclease